jgi:hypothetical protein
MKIRCSVSFPNITKSLLLPHIQGKESFRSNPGA